jgi:hypothetical protein
MRRREFIALLGGAASPIGLPLAAQAQQPEKIPRIGLLLHLSPGPSTELDAFRQGLRELGYIEGQNRPSARHGHDPDGARSHTGLLQCGRHEPARCTTKKTRPPASPTHGQSRRQLLTAPCVVQSGDPTKVSRRKRHASGLLPQLASLAVPEAGAPLPADPRANLSVEHTCHPEIRVHHDAPAARPC